MLAIESFVDTNCQGKVTNRTSSLHQRMICCTPLPLDVSTVLVTPPHAPQKFHSLSSVRVLRIVAPGNGSHTHRWWSTFLFVTTGIHYAKLQKPDMPPQISTFQLGIPQEPCRQEEVSYCMTFHPHGSISYSRGERLFVRRAIGFG